jgi:hypothetical protein
MNEPAQHPGDFASAFEMAFVRLQRHIEYACLRESASDWPAQVAATVRAVLEFAAADPVAADLLTNEALARGPEGIARYHRLIAYLCEGLARGRERQPLDGEGLPDITEQAMAGGVTMLVSQRVDQGKAEELPALAPEAIQFVLTPYLGADEARRVARNPKALREAD